MKFHNPLLHFLLILAATHSVIVAAENPQETGKTVTVKIPQAARFALEGIEDDRHELVGRLSIQRQFMGTRATPQYRDFIQFHTYKGEVLKRSKIRVTALESRLLKELANGRSLPVVMTVHFERKTLGRDGINRTQVLMPTIERCKTTTVNAICTAAEAAGNTAADSDGFKVAMEPGVEADGVAVSLGRVFVRSKATPRSSPISIHGIRVFNTTSKAVSIEIVGLTIEQDGVTQDCATHERSQAPDKWQVAANSWLNGKYEEGEMPKLNWIFDPPKPIKPEKKVTVQLKIKVNGGEPLTLKRLVDPV